MCRVLYRVARVVDALGWCTRDARRTLKSSSFATRSQSCTDRTTGLPSPTRTGRCSVPSRRLVHSGRSKDLEIIVLRHQIAVLHRQNHRPAFADEDRTLLGAMRAHRSEPLSRDHPQIPVSMPSLFRFDASAVVHTCSSSHRTPAPLTARRQPQRSPPRLLTDAACGGLESPPARRPRRTYLHHWHSTDRADDLLHHHHFPSGHTWVPEMRSCALTRHNALHPGSRGGASTHTGPTAR